MIDLSIIRGIGTGILFLAFMVLCFRVFWPKRKRIYDDYGHIPLADDPTSLTSHLKEPRQ